VSRSTLQLHAAEAPLTVFAGREESAESFALEAAGRGLDGGQTGACQGPRSAVFEVHTDDHHWAPMSQQQTPTPP
jgi:hypothetical protein